TVLVDRHFVRVAPDVDDCVIRAGRAELVERHRVFVSIDEDPGIIAVWETAILVERNNVQVSGHRHLAFVATHLFESHVVLVAEDVDDTVVAANKAHLLERNSVAGPINIRSEEHTSELQSRENLVCRLLLEKKNI